MTKADAIKFKANNSWETLLDIIYPIGSVYIAYTSTSPATRFGGSWTQMTGKVLRMNNDVSTGGSDTHTLTEAQLPSHTHTFTGTAVTSGTPSNNTSGTPSTNTSGTPSTNATNSTGAHTHTIYAGIDDASSGIFIHVRSDPPARYTHLTGSTTTSSSDGAHTHTLSNHTHTLASHTHTLSSHTHSVTAKGTNSKTGSGNAHNNLPAYQDLYAWRRTA